MIPRVAPRPREITTFVALAAAAVSIAIPARAFERATVAGDPTTELAWPRRDLELRIADDTSSDVAAGPLREAMLRSFATWTGAGGCTDIELIDGGAVSGLASNLMGGTHDGENRIVFREDAWPADLGPETLAITTLMYRRSTGEILDADVDLNAVDHRWSVDAIPPEGATDVENTVTHELGHFLGFAHVSDPEATMFAESGPGDVAKRDLSADDVMAVCYVYPRGATTPGGERPRPPIAGGCTVGARDRSSSALALGALLAAWITSRIRRAR